MRAIQFGLLLVFFGSTVAEHTCLDTINKYRDLHAKEYRIANMNKLIHNDNLERLVRQSFDDDGCRSEMEFRPDINMIYLNSEQSSGAFRVFMNPKDSHAACMAVKCARTGEEVLAVALWTGMLLGQPGTKCSDGQQADRDGLCAFLEQKKGYVRKTSVLKGGVSLEDLGVVPYFPPHDWLGEKKKPFPPFFGSRRSPDYDIPIIDIDIFGEKKEKPFTTILGPDVLYGYGKQKK